MVVPPPVYSAPTNVICGARGNQACDDFVGVDIAPVAPPHRRRRGGSAGAYFYRALAPDVILLQSGGSGGVWGGILGVRYRRDPRCCRPTSIQPPRGLSSFVALPRHRARDCQVTQRESTQETVVAHRRLGKRLKRSSASAMRLPCAANTRSGTWAENVSVNRFLYLRCLLSKMIVAHASTFVSPPVHEPTLAAPSKPLKLDSPRTSGSREIPSFATMSAPACPPQPKPVAFLRREMPKHLACCNKSSHCIGSALFR